MPLTDTQGKKANGQIPTCFGEADGQTYDHWDYTTLKSLLSTKESSNALWSTQTGKCRVSTLSQPMSVIFNAK